MKAKTKAKRKRSVILTLSLIVVMVYSVVSLVQLQIQINKRSQDVADAQRTLQEQKLDNQELERLLKSGNEKDYIERIARDQLGYVKPGEKVFYDISAGD